jgi:hypothetical protein
MTLNAAQHLIQKLVEKQMTLNVAQHLIQKLEN